MKRGFNARPLIALIAAYAMALQALMPLAVAMVPGDFPICSSGFPDAPLTPVGHGHEAGAAGCCVLVGGQAVLPEPGTHVLGRLEVSGHDHGGHPIVFLLSSPRISPHVPRPPPAA